MKRLLCLALCSLVLTAKAALLPNTVQYQIKGVQGSPLSNIKKKLDGLSESKPLYRYDNEKLITAVNQSLQPYGYFSAEIILSRKLNNHLLNIQIRPGPRVYLKTVEIQLQGPGQNNPELRAILARQPLHPGQALDLEVYNQLKDKLIETGEHQGYLRGYFSTAEIQIDKTNQTAKIHLIYNSGMQYYYGQLRFDPSTISPELLARYVPFHPGEVYSTDKVLELNNNLSNSGYFKGVNIKPMIADEPLVPIEVSFRPVPHYSYSLGAGYGTNTGVRGSASLNVIPVNRLGHKFTATAQGSMIQNALQLQYTIPGQKPLEDQYSLTGNFGNLNYDAGYSNALLFAVAQQHQRNQFQRTLSLNGLVEQFYYVQQPKTHKAILFPKANFGLSNSRNKLFVPTGYNFNINFLGAHQKLLSDLSFAQANTDLKAAYTFEPLRTRIYLHGIEGYTWVNDINQLPLTLAQLLGGSDNLKGYSYNAIGPGKIITYGGIELQKETLANWYLLGFVDAGDVYNPAPRLFNYDIGIGLMWVSPIGPIKVGIAQPTDSSFHRLPGSSPRLVINMGPDL